jgi:hypothetical protein
MLEPILLWTGCRCGEWSIKVWFNRAQQQAMAIDIPQSPNSDTGELPTVGSFGNLRNFGTIERSSHDIPRQRSISWADPEDSRPETKKVSFAPRAVRLVSYAPDMEPLIRRDGVKFQRDEFQFLPLVDEKKSGTASPPQTPFIRLF